LKGIWYAVRSVYWSNSDQKPPYSPIKIFDRILTSNPYNKISNVWSGGAVGEIHHIELIVSHCTAGKTLFYNVNNYF
jgi:hypothetical protein